MYINAHAYVYSCLQFGPFDRHGQPLREDNDVRTSTKTAATTAATCSNTTTKTETKDTNNVTMDDFGT